MPHTNKAAYVNDRFDRESNLQEINVNFSFPVIVEAELVSGQLPEKTSIKPMYLQRVVKDKPRLTTLAQFQAGRKFKKFGHECGVEFLVLSGIFSDADADYSAGYYVRNPAKIYHEPFTRTGCTVLFKLGQFQPLDRKRVVINTRDELSDWQSAGEPGVFCLDLHNFAEESVCLYRIRSEC